MPKALIDAVSVTARDMAKSVTFYHVLGFDFDGAGAFISEEHVEPVRRVGEPRLMIDSAALMEKLNGALPHPPNHSVFALLCDTPAEVDALIEQIQTAGFEVKTQPWNAFWGQRYATVVDPDGYMVDVFAPLG